MRASVRIKWGEGLTPGEVASATWSTNGLTNYDTNPHRDCTEPRSAWRILESYNQTNVYPVGFPCVY